MRIELFRYISEVPFHWISWNQFRIPHIHRFLRRSHGLMWWTCHRMCDQTIHGSCICSHMVRNSDGLRNWKVEIRSAQSRSGTTSGNRCGVWTFGKEGELVCLSSKKCWSPEDCYLIVKLKFWNDLWVFSCERYDNHFDYELELM